MTRLRFRDEWFHLLSDDAVFETEFEKLIAQNAEMLRKHAWVVPFKETIEAHDLPPRKADLALVDQTYRFWWVIEIELVGHDLDGHVLPQVRTFVEGRYGQAHVRSLLRQSSELDADRLAAMINGEQPKVVVISNRYDPRWDLAVKNAGATFAVMNVFRSDEKRDIFSIDGTLPEYSSECLTEITAVRDMRFYRVVSPGALPGQTGKVLTIQVDGKPTTWKLTVTARDRFLMPDNVTLPSRMRYAIYRDDEGVLSLRGKPA